MQGNPHGVVTKNGLIPPFLIFASLHGGEIPTPWDVTGGDVVGWDVVWEAAEKRGARSGHAPHTAGLFPGHGARAHRRSRVLPLRHIRGVTPGSVTPTLTYKVSRLDDFLEQSTHPASELIRLCQFRLNRAVRYRSSKSRDSSAIRADGSELASSTPPTASSGASLPRDSSTTPR